PLRRRQVNVERILLAVDRDSRLTDWTVNGGLERRRRRSRHNPKLTIANTRPEVGSETVLGQVLDQAARVRRDRVQSRQIPTVIGCTVILQRIHQLKLCKYIDDHQLSW